MVKTRGRGVGGTVEVLDRFKLMLCECVPDATVWLEQSRRVVRTSGHVILAWSLRYVPERGSR